MAQVNKMGEYSVCIDFGPIDPVGGRVEGGTQSGQRPKSRINISGKPLWKLKISSN
jgi:hypothetical protein